MIAIFLFVTRDLLLLTYAYLGRTTRRALTGWILWLAVLYISDPGDLGGARLLRCGAGFCASLGCSFCLVCTVPPVTWPLIHIAVVICAAAFTVAPWSARERASV